MDQLRGSRRGVMFTLVTVVIVVLILGEVLTYLYTNTQYSNLGVQATPSSAASALYSDIRASAPAFLQASLTRAFYALNSYETLQGNQPVTNGASALEGLVDNGVINGFNESNAMGNYTLSAYSNTLKSAGMARGLTVLISNANAIVWQGSQGTINASFSTLLNVSSQYGSVAYPITANASVPLSRLPDLYGGSIGTGPVSYSSNRSVVINNTYFTNFNGVNTYVQTALSQGSSSTISQGSLSAWIYAKGGSYGIFDQNPDGFGLFMRESGALFEVGAHASSAVSYANYFVTNSWVYVTVTWNGANVNLYRNGFLVASGNVGANIFLQSLVIGRDDTGYFKGMINDVQVYNSVLSRAAYPSFTPKGHSASPSIRQTL